MLPSDCHIDWTRQQPSSTLSTSAHPPPSDMEWMVPSQGTASEAKREQEVGSEGERRCFKTVDSLGGVDSGCEHLDHCSGCEQFGAGSLCESAARSDVDAIAIEDLNLEESGAGQACCSVNCDVQTEAALENPFTRFRRKYGKSRGGGEPVGDCVQESRDGVPGQRLGMAWCQSGGRTTRLAVMMKEGVLSQTAGKESESLGVVQCLSSVCGSSTSRREGNKDADDPKVVSGLDSARGVPKHRPQGKNCNSNADSEDVPSDNQNDIGQSTSGTSALDQTPLGSSAPQPSADGDPGELGGEEGTGLGTNSSEGVDHSPTLNLGYVGPCCVDANTLPASSPVTPSAVSLEQVSSLEECVDSAPLLSAMSLDSAWQDACDSYCKETPSLPLLSAMQEPSEDQASTSAAASSVDLNDVPDEVLLQVFSYLTPVELCRHVAGVCKCWHRLAYDHSLWRTLDVSDSSVSGFQLCQIVLRTSGAIRRLDMAGIDNLTTAEMAVVAENCPELRELDVGFVDKFNCTMVHAVLTSCPYLEFLNVEGCRQANNEMMRVLAASAGQCLKRLNFSHCSLVDESLWLMMQHVAGLTHLNIDGISWISELVVQHLAVEYSSSLESWELDGNELTDDTLEAVSGCSQLKLLSISFCELLTDHSLLHLQRLEKLERLSLRKGPGLTAGALKDFLSCPTLQRLAFLDLTECQQLDDLGVQAIAHTCGGTLKNLYLSWCWDITDRGMEHVATKCRHMVNMYLVGLHRLVAQWLPTAVQTMSGLRFISFEQCNEVVDVVIEEAVRDKHDLVIINYYGEVFMHNSIPY